MQLIQPQAVTVIAPVSHGKATRYLHATRPMIVATAAMAVAAAAGFVTVIHAPVAVSLALILLACAAAPMGVIFIPVAVIVVSAA